MLLSDIDTRRRMELIVEKRRREFRQRCTDELLDFSFQAMPGYIAGDHLLRLIDCLHDVEQGKLKRLAVFMPPRYGKSKTISQIFPCWMLGKHPDIQIVQAGYAYSIAIEHSRHARDMFVSPNVRSVFPQVIHSPQREGQRYVAVERQAAHEWGTTQGGRYFAVGIGGGLTGRGADIAIIDDPVKNREDAESANMRAKTLDWYRSTLYTRLSSNGAIILVMTPWHPEDLGGVLLDEASDGDKWHVLRFPAVDEDTDGALWPEVWPRKRLEDIKRVLGEREWESLYQCNPTIRGGNMFEMDGIQYHDDIKEFPDARYVRFWDLASSEKERTKSDPDYTIGGLCALTRQGVVPELWVKDMVYCKEEAPKRNRLIVNTTEADGPSVRVCIESVAGYKDTYTTIRDILKGVRSVVKVNVSRDKVVRASPLEPIFEACNVHVLKAGWNGLFSKQFREFPSGAHDDVVDTVSGAYAQLEKGIPIGAIDRRALGI